MFYSKKHYIYVKNQFNSKVALLKISIYSRTTVKASNSSSWLTFFQCIYKYLLNYIINEHKSLFILLLYIIFVHKNNLNQVLVSGTINIYYQHILYQR